MRNNDPLFDLVQGTFKDFSPEVPANAYAGIQKQLKKKSFWNFAYNSLNVYYVGAALGAGLVALVALNDSPATLANQYDSPHKPFATVEKTQHVISTEKPDEKEEVNYVAAATQSRINHEKTDMAMAISNSLPDKNNLPCDNLGAKPETELGPQTEISAIIPAKTLPVIIQGYGLMRAKSILDQVALPGEEIVLTIPVHVEVEQE